MAHELAHQWFGDFLTCKDWSHAWLNEGFATYFEILWKEFSAGIDDADYDRLGDMEAYLDEASHRYRRAIVTNVYHEPIDVFDRHLYEKGGCVLHMLRTELGDARFWKAIRHYVQKHRGGSVETRDLARAVDEATGWNGDRFFEQWIEKAGYPELKVEYSYDDEHKLGKLTVRQGQKTGVIDNTASSGDEDSTTGKVCISGLAPGTYNVTETSPPTGYALPSTTTGTATAVTGTDCWRTRASA